MTAYDNDNIPTFSVPVSFTVTPALGPTAPTIFGVIPGDQTATLKFTPPTNTNGSPITGYTATCYAAGASRT